MIAAAELDRQLIDNFQAVAITLALATVFFGIQYQKVLDVLSEQIPAGSDARSRLIGRLRASLIYRVVPIGAIGGASAYLFLPAAATIVRSGRLEFWSFDFIRTAWMLVLALLALTFVWAWVQFFRIAARIRKARPGDPA
ncbi:MAG TPA: hypothetical protein VME66_05950 [Candidatus Acidoferrales bacterium]|nr:hypothetical protein [Candidatus Acidoferrales bacterium]